MPIAHPLALVALLATASLVPDARAEGTGTRYFELINASHDSVVSVAAAPAGDSAFVPIAIGAPLRGGFTSATLEVSAAHCLQDVRVGLRDGRSLLYRDVDVCRSRGLRLGAADGRRSDDAAPRALADRTD